MILIFSILGVIELLGIVWAVALCRAAERKPIVVAREDS